MNAPTKYFTRELMFLGEVCAFIDIFELLVTDDKSLESL